jgi:carboxyl-terminal processing protease
MLSAIVPALELPAAFAPQSPEQAAVATPVAPAGDLLLAFAPTPTEAATTDLPATFEAAPPPVPSASPLHWTDYVRGLWFTGAAALIVLYGCGVWRVRRVIRDSKPCPEPLAIALRNCSTELELRRTVSGRLTDARLIPLTFGFLRPVILLPAEAAAWPASRLRMVLLHELAHVERHDCLVQSVCQLACAVHWFNPLAWFALARLRVEQERACDDVVLARGTPADDYAAELLHVTAGSARLGMAGVVALAVGRAGRMERRIRDLLDARRNRRTLSRRRAALTITAAAMTVSLIAALARPTSAKGDETPPPTTGVQGRSGIFKSSPVVQGENGAAVRQATDAAPTTGEPPLSADAVRDLILKSTLQDVTAQDLTKAAIRGMLESLHAPHSQLLVGEDLQPFSSEPMVGIGAQLKAVAEAVVVVTPLPNSPAHAAGLKPGDTILAIDGQPPTDLTAAVKAIRGPADREVRLKVRRSDGTEVELSITRGTFTVASATGLYLDSAAEWQHWLSRDAGLAYIRIAQFRPGTQAELQALLRSSEGLRGLVLDLRRCPGGLLPECLAVAKLFIKEGELLTIQGKQQEVQTFTADGTATWADLPLVVLVDGTTASAGEVLAGALQARGRAVIVGERSFGKGTVEQLIPLEAPQSVLKLTTAEMRLPGGRDVQRKEGAELWGVDPTDGYYVPVTADQRSAWLQRRGELEVVGATSPAQPVTPQSSASDLRDPQLAAALDALTARVTTGEFRPTGRPLAELTTESARRESLRAERERLQRELDRIKVELGE